ncbi:hypothetical protein YPPY66_3300 [Yersinia pestis PY-66]|uniref:Uncharacterized protein n=1 Tax=Yersinia pestis PY-08 TaxID=992134 RepID=A0AB72ZGP1_YERPE|nr:hypothetical protein YpMG051020_0201 [Yersinia pestis biovar Orientalis str. MG05-1020]EFA48979.1 hypothetical protein YPD27_3284 [Yersinia pestis KIM D27]EIQ88197.1 hypothetical protein YPPY02_3014 [Yersinia pestis PY-02]EIQ88976.1 hypothetical protein YPPY03_3077 [Yersinia pestis PY-03]EIR00594.1 hypothetical protein YPPY04_3031 [Yersinia pestis PY-04]EIR02042.1 hypothetical protein YPPY05_3009 [Yersinia pestis PY-05]EIR16836.1 hypothetical protein YPPY08_3046 [Yersinia pestis PY-08]EIR
MQKTRQFTEPMICRYSWRGGDNIKRKCAKMGRDGKRIWCTALKRGIRPKKRGGRNRQ